MKIIIEDPSPGEEEHIVVKYHQLSPELTDVINRFKSQSNALFANIEDEIYQVDPKNVLYIESIDNKVFLYSVKKVYESKQKLYELAEVLAGFDFMRISKSAIINLRKIKSLSPAFSGRMEAKMVNDEKIIISRQYVHELKKRLGI